MHSMMIADYKSQVGRWHKSFKKGRKEVADESRSGCPTKARIEKTRIKTILTVFLDVQGIFHSDYELSLLLGITQETQRHDWPRWDWHQRLEETTPRQCAQPNGLIRHRLFVPEQDPSSFTAPEMPTWLPVTSLVPCLKRELKGKYPESMDNIHGA